MKSSYSFIGGIITGMILFVLIIALCAYMIVGVATPNFVDDTFHTDISKFLGDFSSQSILEMVKTIKSLYATENISQPDENGNYYTIADFANDYNIDINAALGMEIDEDLLQLPLFTLFTDDGVSKFLSGISSSTTLSIVNLLTKNMLSEEAVEKIVANTGSLSEIIANPIAALSVLNIGDIVKLDTSSAMMNALSQCSLKCITDFTGGNIFSALQPGGSLEPLGAIYLDEIITGEAQNLIAGITLADFIGDGGISFDVVFDKNIGTLIGYTNMEAAFDASYELVYANAESGTYVYKVDDDTYIMSTDDKLTWNYAENCTDEHEHEDSCYKLLWYKDNTPATGITAILAGMKVNEVTSLDVDSLMADIKIGDLMGDESSSEGFITSLSDYTLKELVDGAYNDLHVGSLLGYSRTPVTDIATNSDWIEVTLVDEVIGTEPLASTSTTGAIEVYYNSVTDQFAMSSDDENYYIAKLNCQDEGNHTTDTHTIDCFSHIWFDKDNAEVSGLYSALSGTTIGELTSGDDAMSLFNDLTLRDVLGDEEVSGGIFFAIADIKIGNLTDEMDSIYIGSMLSYTRTDVTEDAETDYTNVALWDNTDDENPIAVVKYNNEDSYIKLDNDKWYLANNCDNTTAEHIHDADCYSYIWLNAEDAEVTGIEAVFASFTISKLTEGEGLDGMLNTLTLREILGEEEVSSGILASLADITVGDLSTEINNIYIGTMLEYERDEITATDSYTNVALYDTEDTTLAVVKYDDYGNHIRLDNDKWFAANNCTTTDESHTCDIDCYDFIWWDVSSGERKQVEGLNAVLASLTIDSLTDDMDGLIEDMKLSDVLGEEQLTGVLASLGDTKIGELADKINKIALGEVLDYARYEVEAASTYTEIIVKDTNDNAIVKSNGTDYIMLDGEAWFEASTTCEEDCTTHTAECFQYNWYKKDADGNINTTEAVTGIELALANKTITDLQNDGVTDMVNDLTLSDVLEEDQLTGALASLKDTKIGALSDEINYIYVGAMLEHKRNEISEDDVTDVYTITAATSTEDGTPLVKHDNNGNYIMNDNGTWYSANLDCDDSTCTHDTTECYSYKWYNTDINGDIDLDSPITGVELAIANQTLDDLSNGGFDSMIDDMKLSDVLDENQLTGVLASLGDTKISQISAEINLLALGEVLDYARNEVTDTSTYSNIIVKDTDDNAIVKSNGTDYIMWGGETWYTANLDCETAGCTHTTDCFSYMWYEKNEEGTADTTKPITGFELALANKTITDLQNDGVTDMVNDLTLSDVLDESQLTGALASLGDTKIGELSDEINNIYIGNMLEYAREEITNTDEYTTELVTDLVKSNGSEYIMFDANDNKWYSAKFNCDNSTCTHDTAECYSYKWFKKDAAGNVDKTNEVTGIELALANKTMDDLQSDGITDMVNGMTIGEVLGDNANNGVLASLKDTKVKDLNSQLDTILIGNMLGYSNNDYTGTENLDSHTTDGYYNEDGTTYLYNDKGWFEAELNCDEEHEHDATCYSYVWYTAANCGTRVEALEGKIANMSITDIKDGGMSSMVQNITIGEAMGDSIGSDGVLYTLKDTKISNMETAINDLTVGEFLGDTTNSSPLLQSIAGSKLSEVGTTIDNTYLGTVQGNHLNEFRLTNDELSGYTTVIAEADISIIISNTIEATTTFYKFDHELDNGDLVYNEVYLSCDEDTHTTDHTADCYKYMWYKHTETDGVIKKETNTFMCKLSNIKVSEMNDSIITELVSSLTIGEMMSAKLVVIENTDQTTLDNLFGDNSWRELTVTDFISEMIKKVNEKLVELEALQDQLDKLMS